MPLPWLLNLGFTAGSVQFRRLILELIASGPTLRADFVTATAALTATLLGSASVLTVARVAEGPVISAGVAADGPGLQVTRL